MPVMTTWNGADRISAFSSNYFGRPNTWGQRYSNIILQQSDLLIAVGTRLGLQQTGFNWESFLPLGQIIQVDVDEFELKKENPKVDFPIKADANQFLTDFVKKFEDHHSIEWENWLDFARSVKRLCPVVEKTNLNQSGNFINTYQFFDFLSGKVQPGEALIPSSSGSAETVAMQAFAQVPGNLIVTNKGLASMGYGLAGAIGAAIATKSRVIHVEGDGGFSQNLQELGTVTAQKLPIKSFILCNDGYASIRMTQSNYFDGHYVGCDPSTGLGLPDWEKLFDAFGIGSIRVTASNLHSDEVSNALSSSEPYGFLVQIDPNQTYFPKITSKIDANGLMISNPIHLMTPPLDEEIEKVVFKYLLSESGNDE
jgi:acetolactate synthase-1/2/3 large subunit